MSQQYVSSVTVEVAESVVSSSGTADAGKLVALGDAGTLDSSVLPSSALSGVPTGAVQYFAMAAPPTGWLIADGSAISRTDYADLYAAIGTTFGTGDSSTTFNLPDLRGEFIRGYDDGRGVDTDRVFGSTQADAFQNFTGTFCVTTRNTGTTEGSVSGVFSSAIPGNMKNATACDSSTGTKVTLDPSTVARTSTETRPCNVALLACIKY